MNVFVAASTSPKKLTKILTASMILLIVIHVIAMQIYFNDSLGIKDKFGLEYWHVAIFDLDEEESFGTWFITIILFWVSMILFSFARVLREAGDPWHRWWMILGGVFCLMSIEEVVGIHELLNTIFEAHTWTEHGIWVFGAVGAIFVPFLWHYRGRTAILFVLSGLIYGTGALGVEHFSGSDINSLQYNMLTAVEEGLEMTGVLLFLYSTLSFIRSHTNSKDDLSNKASQE